MQNMPAYGRQPAPVNSQPAQNMPAYRPPSSSQAPAQNFNRDALKSRYDQMQQSASPRTNSGRALFNMFNTR